MRKARRLDRDAPSEPRDQFRTTHGRNLDMALTVVEQTALPSKLDQHVARMVSDEPTLTDIAAVLHLLGTADDVDGVRIQTLCFLASRALGRFDPDSRCASPVALAEVVRDARQACANEHQGCMEYVLPWIYNGRHCSPTCERDDERTRP